MATQLTSWNFTRTRNIGKSKYDFALDGKTWKLVRGQDFVSAAASVRHMLYARGRQLKKKVHTQEVPDGIVVMAEPRGKKVYHRNAPSATAHH